MNAKPDSLPEKIEDEVKEKVVALLLVVNESERLATHSYLKALDGHNNIFKYTQKINHAGQKTEIATYHIGNYGVCPVAVRAISPGSAIDGGASTVPRMAYRCFPNLDAIIGLGVACGVEEKVRMCDVLVSSKIVPYDKARVQESGYKPRGETFYPSTYLKNLFTRNVEWPNNSIKDRLTNSNMRIPKVKPGAILSGPFLIDDPKAKKQLIKDFANEAIGIEMEGGYLFEATKQATTHVIIVKAVCDYGDGYKSKEYQPTAALLAADLVKESFSDPQVAKALKKSRS